MPGATKWYKRRNFNADAIDLRSTSIECLKHVWILWIRLIILLLPYWFSLCNINKIYIALSFFGIVEVIYLPGSLKCMQHSLIVTAHLELKSDVLQLNQRELMPYMIVMSLFNLTKVFFARWNSQCLGDWIAETHRIASLVRAVFPSIQHFIICNSK